MFKARSPTNALINSQTEHERPTCVSRSWHAAAPKLLQSWSRVGRTDPAGCWCSTCVICAREVRTCAALHAACSLCTRARLGHSSRLWLADNDKNLGNQAAVPMESHVVQKIQIMMIIFSKNCIKILPNRISVF